MPTTINPAAYWTRVALDANRRDFSVPEGKTDAPLENNGPTLSSRALALVHLAMHDAYFSVHTTQPLPVGPTTWLPGLVKPAGVTSAEGALAGAALAALRGLFKAPGQVAAFDKAMAGFVPAAPVAQADLDWGAEVANRILADRADDLANAGQDQPANNQPYRHRPDPFSSGQPLHGQRWGQCRPIVVGLKTLKPPPGWVAGVFTPGTFYQSEFQEVLKKGALTGHTRTPDETVQANFWAYDGVDKIGTPPRFYCQIALAILDAFAAAPGSTVGVPDYVRLLALMTAGMADAGIQAWHWKYQYDFWRPVVGIREADPSYGPAAPTPGKTVKGHPDWIPLGAPMTNQGRRFTPPFPAYPSGHATFGSTAFQVIRLYAEGRGLATTPVPPPAEPDKIGFSIVSDELDGTNRDPDGGLRPRHRRQFNSLWEATLENSASRIFLGVHWRFDGMSKKDAAGHAVFGKPDKPGDLGDIGGIWLGREIANDLMTNGLKHV